MPRRISSLLLVTLLGALCGCQPAEQRPPATMPPTTQPMLSASQPVVLGPAQLKPFIAACERERARLSEEFGREPDLLFDLASEESAYQPRCQGFAFPNGQVFFAFDTLSVAGAVVFDGSTKQIIAILPWSRTLKEIRGDDMVFDRTFYRIHQDRSGGWNVTALVLAIFGDRHNPRYETWEFYYGPHQGASSNGWQFCVTPLSAGADFPRTPAGCHSAAELPAPTSPARPPRSTASLDP